MKKLTFFVIFLILTNFASCKNDKNTIDININVNPEFLRNGSVSNYSVSNSNTDDISYFTNYILLQPEYILIIKDYNTSDGERIQRFKLDKENLSILNSEIVKNDGVKQDILIESSRKGNYFEFKDLTNKDNPVSKKIYTGREQIFEENVILQMISCFPLNKDETYNFKYVNTQDLIDGEETFKVIGFETITVMNKKYNSIKIELLSSRCTAWFLEDPPHILLRAIYPNNVIELINWN